MKCKHRSLLELLSIFPCLPGIKREAARLALLSSLQARQRVWIQIAALDLKLKTLSRLNIICLPRLHLHYSSEDGLADKMCESDTQRDAIQRRDTKMRFWIGCRELGHTWCFRL